jgi:hypothetical protein
MAKWKVLYASGSAITGTDEEEIESDECSTSDEWGAVL